MTAVGRLAWTAVHVAFSVVALAWLWAFRRGTPLLLTHYRDLDADGVDRQMGALVDALGGRAVEVTLVPLGGQGVWPLPLDGTFWPDAAGRPRYFATRLGVAVKTAD